MSPDVILMSTRQERFYDELRDIAPSIFVGIDNKDYIPSFEHNVMLLAKIVDKEQEAEEKLHKLMEKVSAAQKKFETDPGKALFLIYNNGKFSAFGKGSRFGFIHDVLHIKPVMTLKDKSVHGQRVSNELIAEANPDYLFIVDRNAAVVGKKTNVKEMENRLIKQTNAFKNGKIFYLDPDLWFISGGGLVSVDLMVDDIVGRF
ncbi:Iron compound ABC uptake transporter substrate-binding protein [Sphingobacterium sp. JB170]|nr:Iron compound ABC uptake transporter substrate-binding protein [Sphingobacterium sp. JB170]